MKKKQGFRIEKDVIGEVRVPKNSYFGIQTIRAVRNFPISGMKIHPELNKAIVNIKMAAAKSNIQSRVLDKKKGNAIIKACKEILSGKYNSEFVIDVFQAGAGTPWHMNVNEVIANKAIEILKGKKGNYKIIDPHNHVNYGQSSNDVMPSALRIASLILSENLTKETEKFHKTLRKKSAEFSNIIKTGRTHLQDAVPITLGKEFEAWAIAIEKNLEEIKHARKNLFYLSLGGTAVGTGLNAPKNFDKLIISNLKKQTLLNFKVMKSKTYGLQFMSDFLDLSSALRSLAVDITKIANDIRLLSSGPMTGISEISLPQVEPGSSIMPSKFNPSMAEMMNMVCYQVMGNDEAIKESSASGQLELNFMLPLISHNLLQSIETLKNGIREFNDRCISGIKPNKKTLQEYFEKNYSIGTVLNPMIGYDKTAEVIKQAFKENKPVKQFIIERGILTKKEAEKVFSPKNLLGER